VKVPFGFPSREGNNDSRFSFPTVLLSTPITKPFFSKSFWNIDRYKLSMDLIFILSKLFICG